MDQHARNFIFTIPIKSINRAIVCGHISAYGRDNSRAARPGYDYLMQSEAGFLSMTGEPDGPPARFGLSVVDFMTGMMLAYGITAAIMKAQKTGDGGDVDVSLLDTALHQLSYPGIWYLNEGQVTGRAPRGAHPSVTPSQLVRCKDGWIFIMCQNPRFWELLLEGLKDNNLAQDGRFRDLESRLMNRDALTEELDSIFSESTTEEWVEHFKEKIPIAPVYNIAEALDNPFLNEADMIGQVDHPDRNGMRILRNPIRLDGERLPSQAGPKLGQDTEEVLRESGYSGKEIADLRTNGVI